MGSADEFDAEGAAWWLAEKAWVAWLRGQQQVVTHLASAIGNSPKTNAPMINIGEEKVRAPDIEAKSRGQATYWEVKYRTRAAVDSITGISEHWMPYAAFADYDRLDRAAAPVRIALFEAATATRPGRWLEASIDDLREAGREEGRPGRDGKEVTAWVWPCSVMAPVVGPMDPDVDAAQIPVLVDEGPATARSVGLDELAPLERTVRRARRAKPDDAVALPEPTASPLERAVDADTTTGLDVLRRVLGIPSLPRYSVLRVGSEGCDLDQLLDLLDYGIRLFLITGPDTHGGIEGRGLQHFADARMIEWAVLDDEPRTQAWAVDGDQAQLAVPDTLDALQEADRPGGINVGQYRVVHAPPGADVVVTAGAGTGKTETMSERLVFILSVGAGDLGPDGRPSDLRPSDVALITFTNDAAREIRARLSRTLTMRRRLAPMSVQPLAWLLEIGTMRIATIHTFAKQVVQRRGAPIGVSPAVQVSQHLMSFRRLLHEALSDELSRLFNEEGSAGVPPAHLWEKHIEQVWSSLGGNGVDLIGWGSNGVDTLGDVDWGLDAIEGLDRRIVQVVKGTVEAIAAGFAELCRDTDTLPTDALVPTAIAAIEQGTDVPGLRTVFIDEFQDTDPMQMRLIMALRQQLGTNVFVVGDAKQGIYRFRGAEGDAFDQFHRQFHAAGLDPPLAFGLSWNFRTQADLLDSLHPHFSAWSGADLLPYGVGDQLRAAIHTTSPDGEPLELVELASRQPWFEYVTAAADQVAVWREDHPKASIAILCRINRHAVAVHRELRARDQRCELVVGGDFFQTPAVRELRAFLEAVASPNDDAALLELAETRWIGALFEGGTGVSVTDVDLPAWRDTLQPLVPWQDRIIHPTDPNAFRRDDLGPLRQRVQSLGSAVSRTSTLEWLVDCVRTLEPQRQVRPEDDGRDRVRYLRCLDHLITLLDDELGDAPITLDRVLGWLRLKIDTRFPEDEPVEAADLEGRTTALTVHKAKGLEFDLVLIPQTWQQFGPHSKVATQTAILRESGKPPRLALRWRDPKGWGKEVSNVADDDQRLWDLDMVETAKEEARLLYVALTRGRARTLGFVSGPRGGDPRHWSDLLGMGVEP